MPSDDEYTTPGRLSLEERERTHRERAAKEERGRIHGGEAVRLQRVATEERELRKARERARERQMEREARERRIRREKEEESERKEIAWKMKAKQREIRKEREIRERATEKGEQAAGFSSSPISHVSTGASDDDEIRTSATSLLSSSNTGRLSSNDIRHGHLAFRPPNARGLAGIANKKTISKDNTTSDEMREAELLTNVGKKICNTRQQAKKLKAGNSEWRNRGRKVRRGLSPPSSDDSIKSLRQDLAKLDAN